MVTGTAAYKQVKNGNELIRKDLRWLSARYEYEKATVSNRGGGHGDLGLNDFDLKHKCLWEVGTVAYLYQGDLIGMVVPIMT